MLTTRARWALPAMPVLYVAAIALGYPELFILVAGLAGAFMVAFAWVLRRPDLSITRTVEPARAVRDDLALARLEVRNDARWVSPSTEMRDPCGTLEMKQIDLPRLGRDRTATFRYELPTSRRAAYLIGPLELSRADPFGLLRRSQQRGDATPFWVHPRWHALSGMAPGMSRSLDGPDRDHVPHGSVTFHALREYVIGDDLRHVHWRSSARFGDLMVREHVDTSLPDTTLVVDTRQGQHSEAGFEEAMEAAASIVVVVLTAGYPLRMVTTCGREVRGQAFGNSPNAYLDVLAEVERTDGDLDEVARHLSLGRRGDTMVAVTGRVSDPDLAALGALCRRFKVSVLASIGTDPEDAPPRPQGAVVLHAATGKEFAALWNRGLAS